MTEAAADILKRCKVRTKYIFKNVSLRLIFTTFTLPLQLLHPAVDQFVGSQGKLQLALTHVTLSLNSTLHSLQEIINIVQDKTGIQTHRF